MAQKTCKSCKSEIDEEASICPHCRTRQGMGLLKKIMLGFLALMAIGYISNKTSTSSQAPQTTPDPTVVDHSPANKPINPATTWTEFQSQDPMTSKTSKSMHLVSRNSLELKFPYAGKNKGQLTVRQHPRHGLDVIVTVQKGQILCSSISCSALVRFDQAKPIVFSASEPSDNDSSMIFISDSKRFVQMAKKATRILVQIDFFQNGVQTLEFETEKPLEWPPADAKTAK